MKKINDKDFYTLWGEALVADDRDIYVSEWSTSSIWGEPEELDDNSLIEIAEYLSQMWDAAHMSVKEICKAAELTQAALATHFCIPMRTVWDWCRGVRNPPDYVRLMMIWLLDLLP